MLDVAADIDTLAERTRFSGVVRVDSAGETVLERAYGLADRRHRIPCTVDTQFGLASGTKGLTALTVMSLVEEGTLRLDTPARALLGEDLPLVADDVTVEHLLTHRSGIGDYLDESQLTDPTDYTMSVPVHLLDSAEHYLPALDGHPTVFPAGSRFEYCNSGFVLLALMAERASGVPFPELVQRRVCAPAGMPDTLFLRADELPARAAVGYLRAEGLQTNVLHLPVRGSGDGGMYSTAADVHALWNAVHAGRIVSRSSVGEMLRPRSTDPQDGSRYGLGFWLHASYDVVTLEGGDAGVSFRSWHDPASATTCTVLSNSTRGAWPVAELLEASLLDG